MFGEITIEIMLMMLYAVGATMAAVARLQAAHGPIGNRLDPPAILLPASQ